MNSSESMTESTKMLNSRFKLRATASGTEGSSKNITPSLRPARSPSLSLTTSSLTETRPIISLNFVGLFRREGCVRFKISTLSPPKLLAATTIHNCKRSSTKTNVIAAGLLPLSLSSSPSICEPRQLTASWCYRNMQQKHQQRMQRLIACNND